MRSVWPFVLFILVLLLIDFYAFKGVKLSAENIGGHWRKIISACYWAATVGVYVFVIYAIIDYRNQPLQKEYYLAYMAFGIMLLLMLPKIIIAAFHLLDDVINLCRRITIYIIQRQHPASVEEQGMSRWKFLTNVGLVLAAIPFAGMLYGMVQGRFNFRIIRKKIEDPKIPDWAEGLRIVQLSDIHIGSFFGKADKVLPALKKVNALKPDLILFTGDIVNNHAGELDGWEEHLSSLKAKYGKYAILGNHDYGDYIEWPSAEAKKENLQRLINRLRNMGFRVLLDEMVEINPFNKSPIELLGVQNWGTGGFPKYGDLDKAMKDSNASHFRILMSHDPSHWDLVVSKTTSIDLTLSGHTHGMQFGIEAAGIKWSPAQYRYPHWAGLYTAGKQRLYVNRGFGYLGFPGRVGISPEITLLELSQSS